MGHKRKQYDKRRNPVAQYNKARGGVHGPTTKAERQKNRVFLESRNEELIDDIVEGLYPDLYEEEEDEEYY